VFSQRLFVLRDLIAFGQVGVEIILARENADRIDRATPTAIWFTTGSVPGIPEQTGQTAVLGGAETESTTAQPQNIFDFVCNSAWTSRPMTGS